MKEYIFSDGSMWEGGDWKIAIDQECSEYGGGVPCKHCHSIGEKKYGEKVWICQAVIIAENEGGCNTTGLCLDCVLEAAKKIKETHDPSP